MFYSSFISSRGIFLQDGVWVIITRQVYMKKCEMYFGHSNVNVGK